MTPITHPRRTSFLRSRVRSFDRPSPEREYERKKAEWASNHPEATPAEYTAAMTKLARECGV